MSDADARMVAVIDQLVAALSDVSGEEIGRPVIVIARGVETNGLMVFQDSFPSSAVPATLRGVAEVMESRPPDNRGSST